MLEPWEAGRQEAVTLRNPYAIRVALGAEARWGEATYENEYRIENGRWRIALLHGYMNLYTDFEQGWHKGGVKLLRSIDGLQPDRPPTMNYEAYPQPLVAPYHYDEV